MSIQRRWLPAWPPRPAEAPGPRRHHQPLRDQLHRMQPHSRRFCELWRRSRGECAGGREARCRGWRSRGAPRPQTHLRQPPRRSRRQPKGRSGPSRALIHCRDHGPLHPPLPLRRRGTRQTAGGHPGSKSRGPAAAQRPVPRHRTRREIAETPAITGVRVARPEGLELPTFGSVDLQAVSTDVHSRPHSPKRKASMSTAVHTSPQRMAPNLAPKGDTEYLARRLPVSGAATP